MPIELLPSSHVVLNLCIKRSERRVLDADKRRMQFPLIFSGLHLGAHAVYLGDRLRELGRQRTEQRFLQIQFEILLGQNGVRVLSRSRG